MGDDFEASWEEACREADECLAKPIDPAIERLHRLLAGEITLEQAYAEINHRNDEATASTVEALVFGLREGLAALALPQNAKRIGRLAQLNESQLRAVCVRLAQFKPQIASAWREDEITALALLWRKIHGFIA